MCKVTRLMRGFNEAVSKAPSHPAIVAGDTSVSYHELDLLSSDIASGLTARGVRIGSIVAFDLDHSIDHVALLLGVLRVGAVFLPIDRRHPVQRKSRILDESAATLIVIDKHNSPPSTYGKCLVSTVEELKLLGMSALKRAPSSDEAEFPDTQTTHAAYLIFTSGSSGVPKGVIGSRRALCNRLEWFSSFARDLELKAIFAKTSLGFIDGSTEILGPLWAGMSVIINEPAVIRDFEALCLSMNDTNADTIVIVPSALRALISSKLVQRRTGLKIWITSGEALTDDLQQDFFKTFPGASLINFYGSSEVCGDCLIGDCAIDGTVLTTAISNTSIHILDEALISVKPGEIGELYVSGASLASGYLSKPALTSSYFVANPQSLDGGRMFRTGDLVRRVGEDGVTFIGRADGLVKVRGNRVELAEVEMSFQGLVCVERAVVMPETDKYGEVGLVATVVLSLDSQHLDVSFLRSALGKSLPDYMIPQRILIQTSLPTLLNGKIDRQRIKSDSIRTDEKVQAEVQRLQAMFAEILGIDSVDENANFLDLGGHSLLLLKLASRVRSVFGVPMTVADIIRAPTPSELLVRIHERRS